MKDLYSTINKLIKSDYSLSIEELNDFVITYVTEEKGKEPTAEELKLIVRAIEMNYFDLNYVLNRILGKPEIYDLYIIRIYDKNNKLIKQTLYRNGNIH